MQPLLSPPYVPHVLPICNFLMVTLLRV
jgi:hypothetical protein